MVKLNEQLFYLFYIFCSFTLLVCGEKNIWPNLTNSQETEPFFFGPFGAGATQKKYQEPGLLGKKIRSRSRMKKKSGAGDVKT